MKDRKFKEIWYFPSGRSEFNEKVKHISSRSKKYFAVSKNKVRTDHGEKVCSAGVTIFKNFDLNLKD